MVLDDHPNACVCNATLNKFKNSKIHTFHSGHSLGVAEGRNYLMRRAKGEIFCILDDDAYFANSTCITNILNALESYPATGILACKIIDFRNNRENLLVPFSKLHLKINPYLINQDHLVSYYLGGCHAIRKTVLEKCGYYYNNFKFGEEELDLSYRALQAGFQILYTPKAVAYHSPDDQRDHLPIFNNKSKLYYHTRNRLYLAYKYLPWIYVPSYLTIWLNIFAAISIKKRKIKEYLNGLADGLSSLKNIKRTPLAPSTIQYLKKNYGRLWY